jgi:hypothetical protein
VHVAWVCLDEMLGAVAEADFLHDDVGAVLTGHEQPGVVGLETFAAAVPAKARVRNELGDGAGDL